MIENRLNLVAELQVMLFFKSCFVPGHARKVMTTFQCVFYHLVLLIFSESEKCGLLDKCELDFHEKYGVVKQGAPYGNKSLREKWQKCLS